MFFFCECFDRAQMDWYRAVHTLPRRKVSYEFDARKLITNNWQGITSFPQL